MLGEKHREIVDWLVNDWSNDDRRICVVEGFSGVGKTEVAFELERRASVTARVDAPESGDLDDLLLALSEQLAASQNLGLANTVSAGRSVEAAFEALLLQPVCIVIDEFQRMLDKTKAAPIAPLAALLEKISKRAAPGRLLLLSHYALDKTLRWGERVAFKTLEGLSPEEGAELLRILLVQREREMDIPPSRRAEISQWLGGNPRGLRVLVGCLEQEALDELTGVVPEAWEARDQQVSEGLIARLERELVVRALENLDGASATALEGVSVFRKAIEKDGIVRLLSAGLKFDDFVSALSSRFLIEQRAGRYSLNPIVREISLFRLRDHARASVTAHRAAAGHYTRHFEAKQIVNAGRLGGAFIEARYHLVQSGDREALTAIARRFGDHLQAMYGWGSPSAASATQRDEVIAVLSAFLQDGGPKSMDYYLARLLFERRKEGDIQRALEHVRRSTGNESPASAWVLRLRLEAESAGVKSMLKAAREGFSAVAPEENLFSVYQMASDLLVAEGQPTNAMELLEEGIKRIPPEKGLFSLYLAEAELLAQTGQEDDAILLLRQGLTVIPEEDVAPLYNRVAQMMKDRNGEAGALELLREGIRRVPPDKHLSLIYLTLAEMLVESGQRSDAIAVLEEGLLKISTDHGRNRIQAKLLEIRAVEKAELTTRQSVTSTDIAQLHEVISENAVLPRSESTSIKRKVHIVAVGTEWESRHGGLSTFNRDLCIELATAGHSVVCVVPTASIAESADASSHHVQLVSPSGSAGLTDTERLLLDIDLPQGFKPDLVIGHDRKTGPQAKVLSKRLAGSKLVLFIHTRPEDIEWHKDSIGPDDAATTAEARRLLQQDLACGADLVVGVGPSLALGVATLVHLADPRPLTHRFDPGVRPVSRRRSDLLPEFQCLLLGRAEDLTLKGLDIAARSIGAVSKRNKIPMAPRLIVRGAPVGKGASLRETLVAYGGGKLNVEVRDYSPSVERLQDDILRASLVLMPSRSEGFGLVALEAIAASTPILVSDQSGFAMFLSERLGNDAKSFIVETQENLVAAAEEWERSIESALIDREGTFNRAKKLHTRMAEILTWTDAIRGLEAAWAPLLVSQT